LSSNGETRETRTLQLAVVLYAVVFILKVAAFLTTGVLALLAEAFHTLSDVFISGFLLVAAAVSRKEADAQHMFGHGRAQNVAALVAATLFISFTSFRLYEEAIPRLISREETPYQNLPVALGVIVVSMVIAATPLLRLLRQRTRGAAAKAQLLELVNDELGLLAALAGTLFILWGEPIADPLATIIVATIIAFNALGLLRENASFLLGRSPGPEFLASVAAKARAVPGVLAVHEVRGEYIGPEMVRIDLHILVRRGLPIEEAHRIGAAVQASLREADVCRYCTVHVDPEEPPGGTPGGGEGQAGQIVV